MIKIGDILKIEKTVRSVDKCVKGKKKIQVPANGKLIFKSRDIIVLQFKNYKESFNYSQLADSTVKVYKRVYKKQYDLIEEAELKKMFGVR